MLQRPETTTYTLRFNVNLWTLCFVSYKKYPSPLSGGHCFRKLALIIGTSFRGTFLHLVRGSLRSQGCSAVDLPHHHPALPMREERKAPCVGHHIVSPSASSSPPDREFAQTPPGIRSQVPGPLLGRARSAMRDETEMGYFLFKINPGLDDCAIW